MSCGVEVPLRIIPGKTFTKVFRWGQTRKIYKTVLAATQAAPCVLEVPSHGLKEGWAYQISGARGMSEINATGKNYRRAVVVDADHIEVNELDAHDLDAYVGSSGMLSYNEPVDLTGYTARMQIRRTAKSAEFLLELTTVNGRIAIDAVENTIVLTLDAEDTDDLAEMEAVYDLEMIAPDTTVRLLAYGPVSIKTEVTR